MSSTDHIPDGPLDLAAERARLAKAQAELREMENAVARGELLPRQAVQQTVAAGIERVRSKLLAQIDAMMPRLIGATQDEMEAMFAEAVREALKELDAVEAAFPGGHVKVGETD